MDSREPCSKRLVKQNREFAMMKFSELDKKLAARTYDGMIGTFTTNRKAKSGSSIRRYNVTASGSSAYNLLNYVIAYKIKCGATLFLRLEIHKP